MIADYAVGVPDGESIRIESEGVGSPTHEKAITDALNAIGVHEVGIENGAIHVT